MIILIGIGVTILTAQYTGLICNKIENKLDLILLIISFGLIPYVILKAIKEEGF